MAKFCQIWSHCPPYLSPTEPLFNVQPWPDPNLKNLNLVKIKWNLPRPNWTSEGFGHQRNGLSNVVKISFKCLPDLLIGLSPSNLRSRLCGNIAAMPCSSRHPVNLFKNGPFPDSSSFIFGLSFQTRITIFCNKLMWKTSIQYTVLGFEPKTPRKLVLSLNH